ncbi:MAG: UrcA family protein, partial [Pseudomonadota bacterium]
VERPLGFPASTDPLNPAVGGWAVARMRREMMKAVTLALAAASFGVVGLATPAMAGTTEKRTETVNYAGLDLNTIEGQKLLDQRVEIAARRVCAVNEAGRDVRQRREARACLIKARSSARQQVAAVIEDQRRGG